MWASTPELPYGTQTFLTPPLVYRCALHSIQVKMSFPALPSLAFPASHFGAVFSEWQPLWTA